jgi:hypothetical protein
MDDRLHPDGAPGEVAQQMRQQWGDAHYEAWSDHQKATFAADTLQRSATVDHTRAEAELVRARAGLLDALRAAVWVCLPALTGAVVWWVIR